MHAKIHTLTKWDLLSIDLCIDNFSCSSPFSYMESTKSVTYESFTEIDQKIPRFTKIHAHDSFLCEIEWFKIENLYFIIHCLSTFSYFQFEPQKLLLCKNIKKFPLFTKCP